MGSYGVPVEAGEKTADVIRREANLLDIAIVGRVAYGTYRSNLDGEHIIAFVSPFSRRDGYVYYKSQDETMGPYDVACPKRILDQLSPPVNEYAAEWREKVRAYHAKRAEARKVKPGALVEFTERMEFGGGYGFIGHQFRFIKGSTFRSLGGVRVQITNWRTREYRVVEMKGVEA